MDGESTAGGASGAEEEAGVEGAAIAARGAEPGVD